MLLLQPTIVVTEAKSSKLVAKETKKIARLGIYIERRLREFRMFKPFAGINSKLTQLLLVVLLTYKIPIELIKLIIHCEFYLATYSLV